MSLRTDIDRAYDIWKSQGARVLFQRACQRFAGQSLWVRYTFDAMIYATWMNFSAEEKRLSLKVHNDNPGDIDIHSITWFLPEFQNPFYGGIYTILRFADYLKREKGIDHVFAILGTMDDVEILEKIGEAFPSLKRTPLYHIYPDKNLDQLESTDVGVATLWATAYNLLKYNRTCRKFYFIQDYEPVFYPAGSIYAQIEETYRFGFYGIANTPTIKEIYEQQYGGQAEFFKPCVDTHIFHTSEQTLTDDPYVVFFYGRPEHPRNGFELGAEALRILKKRMGNRVRILAAGAQWRPGDYSLQGIVENLGVIDYKQTAQIYQSSHAGLVMMFTRHPSYLPFELMASGCLVVTNYNPATLWFLKDNENCLLSMASATCLADTIEHGLLDKQTRQRIISNANRQICENFSDWESEIEKIYKYMQNPSKGMTPAQAEHLPLNRDFLSPEN